MHLNAWRGNGKQPVSRKLLYLSHFLAWFVAAQQADATVALVLLAVSGIEMVDGPGCEKRVQKGRDYGRTCAGIACNLNMSLDAI